jgi:UDP-glucose 4-epimerase
MKVLVTGGAGFIGSHLADHWLAQGAQVTVIDNLSTGRRQNLEHQTGCPRFRFVEGDVQDRAVMTALVDQHDIVFHLAAVVGVRHVLADPLQGILTNVHGTEMVLSLAQQVHRRVVFASTSEIYGKNPRVPFAEDDPSVLGPTRVARWSYAASKILDEHLCMAYYARGLPVSIVRYFNAYGPRLDPQGYGSVVASFITQALARQPLTVHGDGAQTRCFTYVQDTVEGTVSAAQHDEALGQAFNIGSDAEISILELADTILRLTGSDAGKALVPYQQAYGTGFEDTLRRVPDVRKARDILGFCSRVPLEQGLSRTIAWFSDKQAHP